ncbi:helix-turn-helix domain-containing protein [Streptomyces sp. FH025]|uniref:AraC-like ligand-binding domain-containing protein n=1 Tax=Streptomyces sp. FH025 TaxID=2815937 RepID=UPI0027DD3C1E|nr:helix-turn-helix domain-containing protein [Streptomyces sp. FH025]
MPITYSTELLSPAERAEFWHDAVARTFIPMEIRLLEPKPGTGVLSSDRLGTVQITRVTAGPQVTSRTRRTIAAGGEGWITIAMPTQGHGRLTQDGKEAVVGPGEFTMCYSSRPFTKELPVPYDFTAYHLPRSALHVHDDDLQAVVATPFTPGSGSVGLVTSYLHKLAHGAAELDPYTAGRLAETAVDLLALLIQERSGSLRPSAPASARAMIARIKDYAIRHLGDPALSPEQIAAANHVSVRYLHKLFQSEETTVARWIQRRRLEMCARELARRPAAVATVSSVAQRWGFVSPAHFSRVFRAAYGVAPRDWRVAQLGTTGIAEAS